MATAPSATDRSIRSGGPEGCCGGLSIGDWALPRAAVVDDGAGIKPVALRHGAEELRRVGIQQRRPGAGDDLGRPRLLNAIKQPGLEPQQGQVLFLGDLWSGVAAA